MSMSAPAALPLLDPWAQFLQSGPVVRTVMVLLAMAVVATWTVFLAKSIELGRARRAMRGAERTLSDAETLAEAFAQTGGVPAGHRLVRAALEERERSRGISDDRDGLKERIALHLQRLEASEGRRLQQGTGILASIGATAPFIGLFGTVWGIMTSFNGLAASRSTSLSAVAPGIAEALLATAMGLVAAIPAVLIYNHLARQLAGCRACLADLTALVMRLASRDIGRTSRTGALPASDAAPLPADLEAA